MVITALLSLLAAVQSPKKIGVLIGVNNYSFESKHLRSAVNDLVVMKLLTHACGFKDISSKPEAKKAEIVSALDDLTKRCGGGDQVLFYFSGKGSINSMGAGGTNLAPTIVPADGDGAKAKMDITLPYLEAWADKIVKKGAHPIVIIDAAYSVPSTAKTRAVRHFDDEPKLVRRPGSIRSKLWMGPGVFLSATDGTGCAFETHDDHQSNRWDSAYTNAFANYAALFLFRQKTLVTYAALQAKVAASLDYSRTGMPNFRPFPPVKDLPKEYDEPVLDMTAGLAAVAPSAETNEAIQKFQEKRQQLRIGLAPGGSDEDYAANLELVKRSQSAISSWCKENLEDVTVVEGDASPSDRVLLLSQSDGKLSILVAGNDATSHDNVFGTGSDAAHALEAENSTGSVGKYLQRQAYAFRIWNMMDLVKPSGDLALSVDPAKQVGGGPQIYSVTGPKGGSIFFFDQNESDGMANLIWPSPHKPENPNTQAPYDFDGSFVHTWPILDRAPVGFTRVRVLVARAEPDSMASMDVSKDEYAPTLLSNLKALSDGMAKSSIKWSFAEVRYEVLAKPGG